QASVTYTLSANVENLTLTGTAAINGTGNAQNNVITGNSGDNILEGGGGKDTLIGGGGNDTAAYTTATAGVTANLATPSSNTGDAAGDTYSGIENLMGSASNDTLIGDANNNILIGGAGADVLNGGAGIDTASYVTAAASVVANLATGGTGGDAAGDTYVSIENLTGSSSDDTLTGDVNANVLTGGAGNDTLDGGAGADTLVGGQGDDTYIVDNTGDVVTENAGEGTDTVLSSVTYTLSANVENLTLTGSAAINGTGNALNNVLDGSQNSVANVLAGGAGDDTYIVGAGDSVSEAAAGGTDTVQASVSYTLDANVENLVLTGSANLNGIGNALNNVITGNSGDNFLVGGGGNDTIDGGAGTDTVLFSGKSTDYQLTDLGNGKWQVTDLRAGSPDGTDILVNVEKLRFQGDDLVPLGGTQVDPFPLVAQPEVTIATASGIVDSAVTTFSNGSHLYIWKSGTALQGTIVDTSGNVGAVLSLGATGGWSSAAALPNGNFVVASISGTSLVVSQYTTAGALVASKTTALGSDVSWNDPVYINHPNIAVLPNGNYAVTWSSTGIDAANTGVGVQIFDATTGQSISSVITANTTTATYQSSPDIAMLQPSASLPTGGFVVAWSTNQAGKWDIYAQMFDASGNKVGAGGQLPVSTIAGYNLYEPSVTGLSNGGFVVTWRADSGEDGSADGVFGRVYSASGSPVGAQFLVNTTTANSQYRPSVTALTDGTFVVTWDTNASGSYEISGQRYDANGNKIGVEFTVNTYTTGNQTLSTVTADANGGFTVTWQSDDGTIRSRTFADATIVDGTTGNDTLTGDGSANIFYGYLGVDTMSGGAGNDTYIVANSGDTINENPGEGIDTVQASVTYTLSANVENLT
ncbi:MAG TPA: calcium-binding protein, partial [Dongiaceae bacterium]|nr:calcium-binding protein [Dongiaceae bacterium]